MAYCDEKKQNRWKSTKTQPTDVTLFVTLLYDKRSHRAKMAYCDEKKQNRWKSTKTQPTDVTLFVGMAFAQVSH